MHLRASGMKMERAMDHVQCQDLVLMVFSLWFLLQESYHFR